MGTVIYTRGNHTFTVEEDAPTIVRMLEESHRRAYFKLTKVITIGWRSGETDTRPLYLRAEDITGFQ